MSWKNILKVGYIPSDEKKRKKVLSENLEKKILTEIEKEGGALGMKNLKQFGSESEIKETLSKLEKEGKIFIHKDGDIYTHKPMKKANCGTERMDCGCPSCREKMEKKLVGNQNEIDANEDGKITGEDFAMLRNETKKAKVKCPKCNGKGCKHCNNTGYHETKGKSAFTARD